MKLKLLFILIIIFASCKNSSNYETNSEDENSTEYVNDENTDTEFSAEESESDEENEDYGNESEDENLSETKDYEDGTYDASVDYYNPKTGYSATYDLEVDVEDGEVVRINFPKGGWLDDDILPKYYALLFIYKCESLGSSMA